ncbi:MAG: FAD-dependent oxidoreductase [Acidobacteriota bacterium]|nr:FAD-dependent oxidoreductase [Acidobacteriota bacterium]
MDDIAQPPSEGPERDREDLLRLASLAAHQLRSPLNSIQTLLSTVIGGFVGPVDPRQRQLLEKAVASCGDGIHLVADLMRLRSLEDLSAESLAPVNLLSILESVRERVSEPAREKEIELCDKVEVADPADAWVRGDPGAVEEILFVLADNAVKYTPRGGRVCFEIRRAGSEGGELEFAVADTGIGIPAELREQVFDEFFRAPNAREMTREGSGLGLAFARRAAQRLGGSLALETAEGGGTRAVLRLERCPECAQGDAAGGQARTAEKAATWTAARPVSRRVVVVGGVAAGSKVAAKVMRLDPDADVTVVERGRALSYAGCGLPYYISGVVARQRDLISTPLGEERDSALFHDLRNVRTLDLTEALEIDRPKRKVRVRSLVDGRRRWLSYDVLVLATGASPVIPKIEGVDLAGVYTLHGVESAEAIKEELRSGAAKDVVIVGAGLLGSEITESVAVTGARVSLVEKQERVMGLIDPDLALLLERRLSASGVKIATGREVLRLEGDGRVQRVVLDDGRVLACDFVILAAGVRPNVELALQAGLELGPTGSGGRGRAAAHLRSADLRRGRLCRTAPPGDR